VAFYDAVNPQDKDFGPILTKMKAAGLEVIYFTGFHAQAGLLMKQSKAMGWNVQWVLQDVGVTPELIAIGGLENVKGCLLTTWPQPNDLPYPEAKDFIAKWKAAYPKDDVNIAFMMYGDAYLLLKYAITQSKSTDANTLAEYIKTKVKNFPGLLGTIEGIDQNGDRIGTPHVMVVVNDKGEFVQYDKQLKSRSPA
jgi:branched-chain amino acid transport system substrate-binding protein